MNFKADCKVMRRNAAPTTVTAAGVEMSHNVLACAVCYKFIPHDARYITTGCFSRTPTLDAERLKLREMAVALQCQGSDSSRAFNVDH